MKLKDLGEIDTGIVVFGGPYSNLQATEAMVEVVRELGLPAICTGDVVAYGANPVATVHAVRAAGVEVVAGNCEKQLAAEALGCGCGFSAGSTCDRLSSRWYAHANTSVRREDRAWMGELPDAVVFAQAGRRFVVIHGGATDISRFIWPTSPDTVFAEEIAEIQRHTGQIDCVLAGHSGIAFQRHVAGVTWINAGVIGMPPNDGRPMTQYVVLQGEAAEICDLHYDVATARAEMERVGLTQGYHLSLETGYWPSEDVLPPELRRAAAASG